MKSCKIGPSGAFSLISALVSNFIQENLSLKRILFALFLINPVFNSFSRTATSDDIGLKTLKLKILKDLE